MPKLRRTRRLPRERGNREKTRCVMNPLIADVANSIPSGNYKSRLILSPPCLGSYCPRSKLSDGVVRVV